MKWYVLNYDFNKKEVYHFNIFNSSRFNDGIKELLEKGIGEYDKFVEDLDRLCKYCFWSKAEYEILVGDLFAKNDLTKIDVYDQLKDNMERLADYILGSNM